MRFRPQRGGYEESMTECVTLDPTCEALARHLNADIEDIEVDFYCHDTRVGWEDTFIVTVDGDVVGFMDGWIYV